MKVTLKILLVAAVALLAYMCYESIMGPITYDNEKGARDSAIIARLIEIRKAQIEYKKHPQDSRRKFRRLGEVLEHREVAVLDQGRCAD